jgi:ATP-dependent helicase/nuclease subunit B
MTLFSARRNAHTIAPGTPFLDIIADALIADTGGDMLELSATDIWVPSRRSGRALAEALLKALGTEAALLPNILPLGDPEDPEPLAPDAGVLTIPPAVGRFERRFELAPLIQKVDEIKGLAVRPLRAAIAAADAIAKLIDEGWTAGGIDWSKLDDFTTDDRHAAHWQESARLLEVIATYWPERLAELGRIDPAQREVMLLDAIVERLQATRPDHRVLVVGSTGAAPSTRLLMKAVLDLPRGAVVFPGVDLDMAEASWMRLDPQHPQYVLSQTLQDLSIPRKELYALGESGAGNARKKLLALALAPAEDTADWVVEAPRIDMTAAASGFTILDTETRDEEARTIAVILREVAEHETQTAALVTPDNDLAMRVSRILRRWDITALPSAGRPLSQSRRASFLRLIASLGASPEDPVYIAALLEHDLCTLGLASHGRAKARLVKHLRENDPGPRSLDARIDLVRRTVPEQDERQEGGLLSVLETLKSALTPLHDGSVKTIAGWAHALTEACEAAAKNASTSIWGEEDGDAIAAILRQMEAEGTGTSMVPVADVPDLIEELIGPATVRNAYSDHPRIAIWGPLEARLQSRDHFILGGLVDSKWPASVPSEPLLSRAMRKSLGLPSPDVRRGLSAHDFAQLAASPRVTMTWTRRMDGAPTIQSPWLRRIETLAKAADATDLFHAPASNNPVQWAREIDRHEGPIVRAKPPAPCPPVDARPRRISASRISTLIRDPYSVYAESVLRIRKIGDFVRRLNPNVVGTAIHLGIEHWTNAEEADRTLANLEKLIDEALVASGMAPADRQTERLRRRKALVEFIDFDMQRRGDGWTQVIETKDATKRYVAGLEFEITGTADRIDVLGGVVRVTDFKSGNAPSFKEMMSGLEPQLPVLAWLAIENGRARSADHLAYFRVTKLADDKESLSAMEGTFGTDGNDVKLTWTPETAAAEAVAKIEQNLVALLTRYFDPDQPYLSKPRAKFAKQYGDYDHLARRGEWAGEVV